MNRRIITLLWVSVALVILCGLITVVVVSDTAHTHVLRPLPSQTRVRMLVQSLQLYANANNNMYPPADAWASYLSDSGYITLDEAAAPYQNGASEPYTFIPGTPSMDPDRILVYGNPDPGQQGVLVGFADSRVDFMTHAQFEHLLAEQTDKESAPP